MADSFGTDAAKAPGPYDITEAELEEMSRKREREYAVDELLNAELNLDTPEVGHDLMARAAVDLRSRGIAIADASQEQLRAALVRVSS